MTPDVPGKVLVTEATHDAAGDISAAGFEAPGTHRLRHVDRALLVADGRGGHHFCSAACAELFAADPHRYVLGQDESR